MLQLLPENLTDTAVLQHAYTDRTVSLVSSVPLEPVAYSTPASIVNAAPAFAPRPSRITEEAQRKRLDLPAAAPAPDDDEAFRPPESREERPSEPAFEVPGAGDSDERTTPPPIEYVHPARRSTPAPAPASVAPPPSSSLPPKLDPPAATPADPSWDLPPPEEDEPLVDEDWMKPPVEEEGFEEFFDRGRAAEVHRESVGGKQDRLRSSSRAREVQTTEDRSGRQARPQEEVHPTTPLPSTTTRGRSSTRSSDGSDTSSFSPPPPARAKTPSSPPPARKTRDVSPPSKAPAPKVVEVVPEVVPAPSAQLPSTNGASRTSKAAPTSSSVPLTLSPASSSDEDDAPPPTTRRIIPSAPLPRPFAPPATKEDLDPSSSDPPFNPSDIHLPRPVPQRQSTLVAEKAKEVLGGWWKGVSEFVVAQTDALATGEEEASEEEEDSSEEERRRRKEKRRKKRERKERERLEREASDVERDRLKARLDDTPMVSAPSTSTCHPVPAPTPLDVDLVPIKPRQQPRAPKSQADSPIPLLPLATAPTVDVPVPARIPVRERAKSISASLDAGFRDLTATVAKAVASRVEAYSASNAVDNVAPRVSTRSKEDRGSRKERKERQEVGRAEETEDSAGSRSHRSHREHCDEGRGGGDGSRRAALEQEESDLGETEKVGRACESSDSLHGSGTDLSIVAVSEGPDREDSIDRRRPAPVAVPVPTPQPSSAYPRSVRDELKRLSVKVDFSERTKTSSSRSGRGEASKSSRRDGSRSPSPPRIKSSDHGSSRSHRTRDDGSRRPEEMDEESRSQIDIDPLTSSRTGRRSKPAPLASTVVLASHSYPEPSSSDSEPSSHRHKRSSRKAKPDRTQSPASIDSTSRHAISSTRSTHRGLRIRSRDDDNVPLRPSSPPTAPAPDAPSFAYRSIPPTAVDEYTSRRSRTSSSKPIEPERAGRDEDDRRSSRRQDSNSLTARGGVDEGHRSSRRDREGRSSRHGRSGETKVIEDHSQRRDERRTRHDESAIEADASARTSASGGRRMARRAGTGRY